MFFINVMQVLPTMLSRQKEKIKKILVVLEQNVDADQMENEKNTSLLVTRIFVSHLP